MKTNIMAALRASNPEAGVRLLREMADKIEREPDNSLWELTDNGGEIQARLFRPRRSGNTLVKEFDVMPSMRKWAEDHGIPMVKR